MTQGSSRFRTGRVTAPATPVDRMRAQLGDGQKLFEVAQEVLEPIVLGLDHEQLLAVLQVVREHDDHHRVYLIHKLAASMLLEASRRTDDPADRFAWARYYDLVPSALLPYLEERPSEPELLNLLGLAWYELGETPLARRLFEAIKEIEPEHAQARVNLRACKERAKRGVGVAKVPESHTRHSRALHAACKRIAERATRLEQKTISLCMIVRDEEEMLPGCLDAVREWVDQVIVVDTGSTDRTRQIALERGATVIDFPWTGSFSEARNRSIEDATGDWILYLDADEHLVDDDGRYLRELARKTWVEGFYLVETHFTGEAEIGSQSSHMALRMFQRRAHYHWQGIIHEQKLHNFPTWLPERFQNSPVRINHYGYLRAVVDDRAKRERNLELLMQQAAEGPDAFTEFNIGSEYGAMNDWARARPHFERALELAREEQGWFGQQFAPMMVSRLVTSRRGTGDDDGALELIAEALAYWPDFTDLIFERAGILASHEQLDAARAELERCIALGDAPARYVAVQGKGTYQARGALAGILHRQGDRLGARQLLEQALEEAPHYLPTVLELADLLLETDAPGDVARRLDEHLGERANGPAASLLLATAFYERAHLEHAERYYERVLAAQPLNSAALIALSELRMAQGRHDEAYEIAGRVDPLDPLVTRAARSQFLAAVVAGRTQAADLAGPLERIVSAEYLATGERAFYTAWHARLTGGAALLPADAAAAQQAIENLEALARLEAADEFEQLVPLLEQAVPDDRERHLMLGGLYLRRRFTDMAAEEFMLCAQRYGPDPQSLTGLGKVATMKEMWEDAEVFLSESLRMEPAQGDAQRLLQLIRERTG